MRRAHFRIIIVFLVFCPVALPAQTYTAIDLSALAGQSYSEPTGINNSGQVVGYGYISDPTNLHIFLYKNGAVTDLGPLGGTPLTATQGTFSVNDSGQVAGYKYTANRIYAFLYSGGSMINLGTLPFSGATSGGDLFSAASAINNSGQVVGTSGTLTGYSHAFLYAAGSMTDLGTLPGGRNSYAYGINDSGQVVGFSDTTTGSGDATHAFLYSGGKMTDLASIIHEQGGKGKLGVFRTL